MRVHDGLTGAALLLLSLAVLWHIQSFPPAPGQPYSSALFPGLIAGGLAICSILLIVQGVRSRAPWFGADEWVRSPRQIAALALTAGSILFYIVAVDRLGFVICSLIMLSALFWSYGVRRRLILPVALVVTLAIHGAFYKLLKVPLPWGILQPIAW